MNDTRSTPEIIRDYKARQSTAPYITPECQRRVAAAHRRRRIRSELKMVVVAFFAAALFLLAISLIATPGAPTWP